MGDEPTTFNVRCVCGKPVTILRENIGSHIICQSCNRTLIPVKAETMTEFVDPASSAASGTPAQSAAGTSVFDLRVSQWDNFWRYVTCGVFQILAGGVYLIPELSGYANMIFGAVLLVDLISVYIIFSTARNKRYLINADRIETRTGIWTKEINWISLNSVLDIQLKQTLIQRLVGIGSIRIKSTDHDTPLMVLEQLPQAQSVFEFLQRRVSHLPHGYSTPTQGRA
ncbi:MAG TPA: PH domain-containing protein [Phycisphaerae bacterium]|nr:PH domain-containing protein [Phycisphaerae bacterium]